MSTPRLPFVVRIEGTRMVWVGLGIGLASLGAVVSLAFLRAGESAAHGMSWAFVLFGVVPGVAGVALLVLGLLPVGADRLELEFNRVRYATLFHSREVPLHRITALSLETTREFAARPFAGGAMRGAELAVTHRLVFRDDQSELWWVGVSFTSDESIGKFVRALVAQKPDIQISPEVRKRFGL